MKIRVTFLFVPILILTFGVSSCGSEPKTAEEKFGLLEVAPEYDRKMSELVSDTGSEDLGANTEAFAIDLMEKVVEADRDKNIMVSPLSILLALSMTMNGADTSTLQAMLSGLGFDGLTLKEVNTYLHRLVLALEENEKVVLEIANSIWAVESYQPLKRSFYEIVTDYYNASIFPLSGVDPINEWVADATHDKITEILKKLPADTVMVLVNAIYFNGTWLKPFDKEDTDRQEFHTAEGDVEVDMMHNSSKEISYKRGLDYEAVAIPYKDKKTSLYVFVPSEGSSLQEFYDQALYSRGSGGYYEHRWEEEEWQWVDDPKESVFSGFIHGTVSVSLPRFSFEFEKSLKEDLTALGMGEIFSGQADFSNFAEGRSPYVEDVIHKTFLDVNEEGTEAAAVTAVVMTRSAAGFYIYFKVDRPFFFCIRDDETQNILFLGQVTNPSE